MLTLKPSLRNDRRYILVLGSKGSIESAILEFIGVLGFAEASPVFVSEKEGKIIVAVNREALTKVKAAFALAKENLKVLRVSGTLKGLGK